MRRRSVADELRALDRQRLATMTASERVAQALALGARCVDTYSAANDLDRAQARRCIERYRQATRRRSACVEATIS